MVASGARCDGQTLCRRKSLPHCRCRVCRNYGTRGTCTLVHPRRPLTLSRGGRLIDLVLVRPTTFISSVLEPRNLLVDSTRSYRFLPRVRIRLDRFRASVPEESRTIRDTAVMVRDSPPMIAIYFSYTLRDDIDKPSAASNGSIDLKNGGGDRRRRAEEYQKIRSVYSTL